MKPLAFPVVANVDARPNTDPARVKELLVRQVDGAVRWEQAVRLMHVEGVTHALEIGPGKVLAGLGRRIAKEMKVLSVGDVASLDSVADFLARSACGPLRADLDRREEETCSSSTARSRSSPAARAASGARAARRSPSTAPPSS